MLDFRKAEPLIGCPWKNENGTPKTKLWQHVRLIETGKARLALANLAEMGIFCFQRTLCPPLKKCKNKEPTMATQRETDLRTPKTKTQNQKPKGNRGGTLNRFGGRTGPIPTAWRPGTSPRPAAAARTPPRPRRRASVCTHAKRDRQLRARSLQLHLELPQNRPTAWLCSSLSLSV